MRISDWSSDVCSSDLNIIAQLRENGEVQRGWLGVRIQNVTDELAEGLRLDRPRGALVAAVTEGGPAQDAGIEQGDVILAFAAREVTEMGPLPAMVADRQSVGQGKSVPGADSPAGGRSTKKKQ